MSKYFRVVDYNKRFNETKVPVIILNDLPAEVENERNAINKLIMTTYDNTDILSCIPTCQCGHLVMGYNLGRICPKCLTAVERPVENTIESNIWFRAPNGIDGFINPSAWNLLTKYFSGKGYNIIEWLVNPSSKIPPNVSKITLKKIEIFESQQWPRGLNNFIRNFDKFIQIIPLLKIKKDVELIEWLQNNKELLFPKYLPLPIKTLLVLENNNLGSYADLSIIGAIDAARTLVSITREEKIYPVSFIEKRVVSIIKNISGYIRDTLKEQWNGKRGMLRGQLFRSRSPFCMRGVITSISDPHYYEEVHIPWAQGLELFKFHILSKLVRRGWNITEAFSLIEANGKVYVPLLDEIMKELINETERKGIPIILQRNPSLTRASAQNLLITKVKTDIEDQTQSFSVLCLKGSNADFDKPLSLLEEILVEKSL